MSGDWCWGRCLGIGVGDAVWVLGTVSGCWGQCLGVGDCVWDGVGDVVGVLGTLSGWWGGYRGLMGALSGVRYVVWGADGCWGRCLSSFLVLGFIFGFIFWF